MINVRFYGDVPYRIAVIHGGPGAPGSVAAVARELSKEFGVLEPLQTRTTVDEQVIELYDTLSTYGQTSITLIGHSWGAWLAFIFAAKYPAMMNKLILVGSGPFEDTYLPELEAARMNRLSDLERVDFTGYICRREGNELVLKAFIFDMDGVIIDSEPLHFEVDQMVMKTLGTEISQEELEDYVGMTNPEMWSKLKGKYALKHSVEEIIQMQTDMKLVKLRDSDLRPIAGITELLGMLEQHRFKIGLASSSPRLFIEAVLREFNLINYFQCIISGEEVPHGKPAPDIYLKAAELLQMKVEQCIVLEDSKNGITAAKSAGMKCIGFRNFHSGQQDLSKADVVVDHIKEINLELFE